MSAQIQRLSQSERSARTRDRLITAAIEALSRYGYAATSTTMVAERSGVSRGAMLHQFPTKVDLMLAVTRSVFEDDLATYRREMAKVEDPREKLLTLLDCAWRQFSAPGGMATTEIWMATRSDPELAAAVLPVHEQQTEETKRAQAERFAAAGLDDKSLSDALLTLHVSALRGLALERALGADEKVLADAMAVVRNNVVTLLDRAGAAKK